MLAGDLPATDADGYFFYQLRTDDMIISAGYNIAAVEVEDVLLRHEAVAECAVIGQPDDERGQIPASARARSSQSESPVRLNSFGNA